MADQTGDGNAEYFVSICDELAKLAEKQGFMVGAYLLKVASLAFAERPSGTKTFMPIGR